MASVGPIGEAGVHEQPPSSTSLRPETLPDHPPRYGVLRHINRAGIVAAVACCGTLVYLAWRNADGWIPTIRNMDIRYLFVAFLPYSCALFIAAYTWHCIISAVTGGDDTPRDIRIYVCSAFARRLPGSLWGTALRMYWYRAYGGDWRTVGVASVLEVWALTISGGAVALLGAVLFAGPTASLRTWIGMAAILIALGTLFSPRINRFVLSRLTGLLRAPPTLIPNSLRSAELSRWVALAMINWVCGGLMLAAVVRALSSYSPEQIPNLVVTWAVAGTAGALITFVPGGFGVVELALTGLLSLMVPTPVALATAVGLRLFVTVSEFIWMVAGMAAPSALTFLGVGKR